jgi:hypothetical protein
MTRSLGVSLVLLSAIGLAVAGVARGGHGHGNNGKDDDDKENHGHGNQGHEEQHKHQKPQTLLQFGKMFGVDGAFVGNANPVDDIPGDELPWEISSARGQLDTEGDLFLAVRGIVFKDDPSVPPALRGINDETEFRAAVSCLTDQGGQVVRSNVITAGFPANKQGDSVIDAHVALPDPCIAPAVFVLAGSENKWFAVTGFETEEE